MVLWRRWWKLQELKPRTLDHKPSEMRPGDTELEHLKLWAFQKFQPHFIYLFCLSVQVYAYIWPEVHTCQRTACGSWLSPSIRWDFRYQTHDIRLGGKRSSLMTYFGDPHFLHSVDDVTAMRKLPSAHGFLSLSNLQVLLFLLGHFVYLSRRYLVHVALWDFDLDVFCHLWNWVIDLLMTQWNINILFTSKKWSGVST